MFLFAYLFVIQAANYAIRSIVDPSIAITFLNFIFGTGIVSSFDVISGAQTAGWPPLLSIGGNAETSVAFLFLGLSFIIYTLIPKAADIIQGLISGRPLAYGSAIGEAIGQPVGAALRGASISTEIGRAYSTRFGTRGVPSPPTRAALPRTPKGTGGYTDLSS
jgi:hypothetical protein